MKLIALFALLAFSLHGESAREKQLAIDNAKLAEQLAVADHTIAALRASNATLQQQHGSDAATIKLLKSSIPTLTPETKQDINTAKEKLSNVETSTAQAAQSASNTEEMSGQSLALARRIHSDNVTLNWMIIGFIIGLSTITSFIGYLLFLRLRVLTVDNLKAELDRLNLSKKMDTSIEHSAEAIYVANNVNTKIAKVAQDTEIVAKSLQKTQEEVGTTG